MDMSDVRRRMLTSGKSLLPFIIWDNTMSSLNDIPVEYSTTGATILSNHSIEISSGVGTKNFVFIIPKEYVKQANQCNIKWYIKSAYSTCNVKIVCDGQTITDNGTANVQTRTFAPNISELTGEMTITFTGSGVRILSLTLE